MVKLKMDEQYQKWERVETYVRWMVKRVTASQWDFGALRNELDQMQRKGTIEMKLNQDDRLMHQASNIAVEMWLLEALKIKGAYLIPAQEQETMRLTIELLTIHIKHQPFPLQFRDAIFTVVSERIIKTGSTMEVAQGMMLSIEAANLLLLAEHFQNMRN
jgi:hypothetical protein